MRDRLGPVGRDLYRQRYGIALGAVALIVALGLPAQARTGATTAANSVAKALGIAKKADKRSKQALALAQKVNATAGPQGTRGDKGDTGAPGSDAQFNGAAAGGDLTGSYPNPTIGVGKVTASSIFDGTIGAADLAAGLDSRIPSQIENDALAGTSGTPGAGNAYVTNADPRNTNSRAPTGTATGDLTGTYPSPTLAAGAVNGGTAGDVSDNSLTKDDLAADSVDASELGAQAVGSGNLSPGSASVWFGSSVPFVLRLPVNGQDSSVAAGDFLVLDAWSINTAANSAAETWVLKDDSGNALTNVVDVSGSDQDVHRVSTLNDANLAMQGEILNVDVVGSPNVALVLLAIRL